jgi:hypothetical protein
MPLLLDEAIVCTPIRFLSARNLLFMLCSAIVHAPYFTVSRA